MTGNTKKAIKKTYWNGLKGRLIHHRMKVITAQENSYKHNLYEPISLKSRKKKDKLAKTHQNKQTNLKYI